MLDGCVGTGRRSASTTGDTTASRGAAPGAGPGAAFHPRPTPLGAWVRREDQNPAPPRDTPGQHRPATACRSCVQGPGPRGAPRRARGRRRHQGPARRQAPVWGRPQRVQRASSSPETGPPRPSGTATARRGPSDRSTTSSAESGGQLHPAGATVSGGGRGVVGAPARAGAAGGCGAAGAGRSDAAPTHTSRSSSPPPTSTNPAHRPAPSRVQDTSRPGTHAPSSSTSQALTPCSSARAGGT